MLNQNLASANASNLHRCEWLHEGCLARWQGMNIVGRNEMDSATTAVTCDYRVRVSVRSSQDGVGRRYSGPPPTLLPFERFSGCVVATAISIAVPLLLRCCWSLGASQ